ncbi:MULTISPECIES: LacI family DNA-binding transcriptional regulator [Metabacillus]|uniref:LacI family transcriptional regulator n=2 Tax=Metabacillus TaxID=2675233 RepID=A0A179T2C0_9BACI|nr:MULTISPECIES: LacI family DNA-binding transcriptional regulator [Metabacillus]OAS87804.1 LacI family transcriptional regulator [Metabacillus litoralis]QNF27306.1 LacI family DNA-binding transcriptional regulator [Metabacillus sp. KUDC1714]
MAKKITMQDIADRLQISKNSVSQALSGKPGVSEETRRIVETAARELGYEYTSVRNQLQKSEQNKTFALIASEFAFSLKSFFGEIYLSIERELSKQGIHLLIQPISEHAISERQLPSFVQNKSVDGILILSHLSTDYINEILSTNIPTILIDHHHPHINADAILTNNRFGAYTAVEHLLKLGHRKIGFVGNTSYSPSYYERLEGYRLALHHHEIKIDPTFILSDVLEEDEDLRISMSKLPKQPTAWFCVNDGFGFLVCSYLYHAGIKIPDQISVCNFDNGQLSQISNPKITTMDIDLKLYGIKAVEQLIWRINNKDAVYQEILLPTTLIKRASTGPVLTRD